MAGDPSNAPLSGIRVLDFSRYLQGPYAAELLASLGAEVIKIEPRRKGEISRRVSEQEDGYSPFFEALNGGKRSFCVDLRNPAAQEIVLRLAATADVILENFRPGVMNRRGLGYDDVRAINPAIIYASASGFGPDGPRSQWPMFDGVAQAVAGFMDACDPNEPHTPMNNLSDSAGALFLTIGILTALYNRQITGKGQQIDGSLLGASIALQPTDIATSLRVGEIRRYGRRAHSTAGQYECADGKWVVIAANNQRMWFDLCAVLGRSDLTEDPRYANGRLRSDHAATLEPELADAFRKRTRDEWIAALAEVVIPVGPVNSYLDLVNDPDVIANGYLVPRKSSRWGTPMFAGFPIHFSETPALVVGDAPEVGVDTWDLLHEVGYADEEIAQLVIQEVL